MIKKVKKKNLIIGFVQTNSFHLFEIIIVDDKKLIGVDPFGTDAESNSPYFDVAMSESPPLNFSWIDVGRLAAMGWPQTVANLSYLVSQGIGTLVTLSPERRPPVQFPPELSHREIPIEEFQVPTFEQIDEFIEICRKNHSENQVKF